MASPVPKQHAPRAWVVAVGGFILTFVALLVLLLVLFGDQAPAERSLRGFFYDFPRVTVGATRYYADGLDGWLYMLGSAIPALVIAYLTQRRFR